MKTKPAAMLWELIGRLANTNLTIRISGEFGVGKAAIARLLYSHYPEESGTFKRFDCKNLSVGPRENAAGDLCVRTRTELDRALNTPQGHVIYFENIECLPVDLQARLLHMLDGNYPDSSPWVIVSSIEPLDRYQSNNQISQELFDSLNTIHIALPPLRARPDRIPHILSWLLNQVDGDGNSGLSAMPDMQLIQQLIHYHWPGNWRQLQQVALAVARSRDWLGVIETMKAADNGKQTSINEITAIHILSSARIAIRKERVMDGLMTASSLDEVGLLDLAIYNEAVAQIADHFSAAQIEDDTDPTSDS